MSNDIVSHNLAAIEHASVALCSYVCDSIVLCCRYLLRGVASASIIRASIRVEIPKKKSQRPGSVKGLVLSAYHGNFFNYF